MQRAIMIGAGNIGRGFIGALLAKSGYQVLFADVNQSIIDAINEKKQYTVHIKDTICRDFSIQNVRGISSAGEALCKRFCNNWQDIDTNSCRNQIAIANCLRQCFSC